MRVHRMIGLLLLGVAALGFLTPAFGAGYTAYVNMETIFEGYYKTLRANAAFEQKKRDFEERMSILRDELQSMVSEAKKLEENVTNELLSQEARDDARRKLQLRVERLRAKEEEFGQFRRDGMRDLNKNRLAAEKELIDDITEFVRSYCKGKGYRVVYDINGRSLNRVPVLLLYPEDEEITDATLAEINKGHEQELEKAKTELEAIRKAADDKANTGTEGTDMPGIGN